MRPAVSGIAVGESLPFYVRDASVASLHKLGVSVLPYMRLYGSDSDTVYLQHVTSGEAVVIESVDTLVLCTGHQSVTDLADALDELSLDVRIIGDAIGRPLRFEEIPPEAARRELMKMTMPGFIADMLIDAWQNVEYAGSATAVLDVNRDGLPDLVQTWPQNQQLGDAAANTWDECPNSGPSGCPAAVKKKSVPL